MKIKKKVTDVNTTMKKEKKEQHKRQEKKYNKATMTRTGRTSKETETSSSTI